MGFSRQEHWSGLPFPPLGDLPNPGIEPVFPATPALQADSLPTEPPEKPIHLLCPRNKRVFPFFRIPDTSHLWTPVVSSRVDMEELTTV